MGHSSPSFTALGVIGATGGMIHIFRKVFANRQTGNPGDGSVADFPINPTQSSGYFQSGQMQPMIQCQVDDGENAAALVACRAEVASLQEQLEAAERLTAIGELASTTTHEFNNILMTILNYAKLGLRQRDEASRTKAFDKILTAATRAAKITSTILGVARNRTGRHEPTDLTELVDDALLLLEREMTKYRIAVERYFAAVPLVLVDGNQIQQVLVNLLINARQAMPNGGRLVVKIAPVADGKTVELMVRDFGNGIPSDILPRIFEPRFTTKLVSDGSGVGGSGLGLATCKRLIESHRGWIRVESRLGKGTAFTIRLPVAEDVFEEKAGVAS